MACILVHEGETGRVRIGDVVFSWRADATYPLHVGVAFENASVEQGATLRVVGLPDNPRGDYLGSAVWGGPKQYVVSVVGRRLDVDEVIVKEVALLAEAVQTEHSQLATQCTWDLERVIDENRRIRDGIPMFVQGTCSDFVEYLYEHVRLDLVDGSQTFPPEQPNRVLPATQLHAFWTGSYPLRTTWSVQLETYPTCRFGTRADER